MTNDARTARAAATLRAAAQAHERAAQDVGSLTRATGAIVTALQNGRKVLAFGNGGSAADAQHFVAELVGRYLVERRAWPAIALSTDTSILTALGNDYGFDRVFARQVAAHGQAGDIALGISTSGNSPNVLRAQRSEAKDLSFSPTSPANAAPFRILRFVEVSRVLIFLTTATISRVQRSRASLRGSPATLS